MKMGERQFIIRLFSLQLLQYSLYNQLPFIHFICSIIISRRLLMNRSFSNSFQSTAPKNGKKLIKHNSSCTSFQTIIKSRDNHSMLKTMKSTLRKQTPNKQGLKHHNDQLSENQLENSQDIKNYVKALNKSNQDWGGLSKLRESYTIQNEIDSSQKYSMVKSQSQPKLGKTLYSENIPHLPLINVSIQDLSKKIQELLEFKLMRKSKNRNFMSLRTYDDQLQKDLKNLIEQLQAYQTLTESENSCQIDFEIKQIVQKISLIQKIIAQSFTQSEILKKYFFMKKLNRKPFTVLENKQIRQTFAGDMPAIRYPGYVGQYPSLHYSTTNQSSYSKPNKEAYHQNKIKNKIFHPNRQNLEKSTYQTEFLNYGSLPVYPQKNSSELHCVGFVKGLDQNHSTYQTDFKQKRTEIIDSKQLDCRHDKFKPTQISFMPKKMMELKEQKREKGKKGKTHHKLVFDKNKDIISASAYQHKLSNIIRQSDWSVNYGMKSEYGSKFSGEKSILQCLAKQTNLTNLKYEFKKTAQA